MRAAAKREELTLKKFLLNKQNIYKQNSKRGGNVINYNTNLIGQWITCRFNKQTRPAQRSAVHERIWIYTQPSVCGPSIFEVCKSETDKNGLMAIIVMYKKEPRIPPKM